MQPFVVKEGGQVNVLSDQTSAALVTSGDWARSMTISVPLLEPSPALIAFELKETRVGFLSHSLSAKSAAIHGIAFTAIGYRTPSGWSAVRWKVISTLTGFRS